MIRQFTRHLQHYLPLMGIVFVGFFGFWFLRYDKSLQMAVSIASAVGYVSWGIIHHHIHRDLQVSVVIEYLAIAILGVVIVASMLFRA